MIKKLLALFHVKQKKSRKVTHVILGTTQVEGEKECYYSFTIKTDYY